MSAECYGPTMCACSLDLVWDDDLNATAVTSEGTRVPVGPSASLSPAQLLALAASSCYMTTLFALAADAGVAIEGYVSSARVGETPEGTPEISLAPCIVVHSEADGVRLERLWKDAADRSPTLRLMRASIRVEPAVRVAPMA